MADTKIEPYRPIIPMIYAYTTPEIKRHQGWTKIGYTNKQTVKARINEQVHTAKCTYEEIRSISKLSKWIFFAKNALHAYFLPNGLGGTGFV